MPFVGARCAECLGCAGVEAECKPAQHVVLVVCWSEYSGGALVELASVGCEVLVWRSSDQAADSAV